VRYDNEVSVSDFGLRVSVSKRAMSTMVKQFLNFPRSPSVSCVLSPGGSIGHNIILDSQNDRILATIPNYTRNKIFPSAHHVLHSPVGSALDIIRTQ